MLGDYFDYHPYRFQLLTAACDMRIESLRGPDGGDAAARSGSKQFAPTEFGEMSRAEFSMRLELATQMREVWNRWNAAGSEIFDFSSDMRELAGSKVVELPWCSPLTALGPLYVHFGSEAALALSENGRAIEGAYLETGSDVREVVVRFVCNQVSRGGTVGDALISQSDIIIARLDRETDEFVEFNGNPILMDSAPEHALLARLLFSLAHLLGPAPNYKGPPSHIKSLLPHH